MEDTAAGNPDNPEPRMPPVIKWGFLAVLGSCIITALVYITAGLSDTALFAVLRLMRFFASFLMVLSLCAVICTVWRMVKYFRVRYVFFIFGYLTGGLCGAALLMLNTFIVAAAGGYGSG